MIARTFGVLTTPSARTPSAGTPSTETTRLLATLFDTLDPRAIANLLVMIARTYGVCTRATWRRCWGWPCWRWARGWRRRTTPINVASFSALSLNIGTVGAIAFIFVGFAIHRVDVGATWLGCWRRTPTNATLIGGMVPCTKCIRPVVLELGAP